MVCILIDLTTARNYIGRNAVGIVRTEREIAIDLFANNPGTSGFYFDSNEKKFFFLSYNQCDKILMGDVTGSAIIGEEFDVANYASAVGGRLVILSCGLSWDHNFLEHLYVVKLATQVFVVQIVYDVIPTIMPEYCVPGMELLFPRFVIDAAWTADLIYCISKATATDFERFVRVSGAPLPDVRLIELGCDVDTASDGVESDDAAFSLDRFVLYVSSIEPRKNHKLLFDLWRSLYQELGSEIPALVFVGKQQWNSSDLVTMIKQCSRLYPSHIRIMEAVTDAQLNWLYRHCMFTVYPSLYEGWGLPVRESFLHGKVCVASANSGTLEASDGLAVNIHPLDFQSWYSEVRTLITDPSVLENRQRLTRERFEPLTWSHATARFREDLLQQIATA